MSLRVKVLILLALVVSSYALLQYGLMQLYILPNLVAIQRRGAEKDVARCVEAIYREEKFLFGKNLDWSSWDAPYQYVQDANLDFETEHLTEYAFGLLEIQLLMYVDKDLNVIWSDTLGEVKGQPLKISGLEKGTNLKGSPFIISDPEQTKKSGIIVTDQGPYLVTIARVYKSDGEGPPMGQSIMARFLDPEKIQLISEQTKVEFKVWAVSTLPDSTAKQEKLSRLIRMEKERPSQDHLALNNHVLLEHSKEGHLFAFTALKDMSGKPALLLRAKIDQEVVDAGSRIITWAVFGTLGAGILILLINSALLEKSVVQPVIRLTERAKMVGTGTDSDSIYAQKDEIGILSRQLNLSVEQSRNERQLLRQLIEMHERDRALVSYEIHDGLAQYATGALMRLEAIRTQVPEELLDDLDTIRDLTQKTMKEARSIISGLRPPILDEFGLVAAVDHLVNEINSLPDSKLRVELTLDTDIERLANPLENTIFRIIQEALTNSMKHSKASSVKIEMNEDDDNIYIDITDNGEGFDITGVDKSRFGLRGIRERVRIFDGDLKIETSPGNGCKIQVSIPVILQDQSDISVADD